MGPGHVKFFVDKTEWLYKRYLTLHKACVARGFNVHFNWPLLGLNDAKWESIPYTPTKKEITINRARIQERWPKNARYYGKPISQPL